MDAELKLKEMKGKAQNRFDEIYNAEMKLKEMKGKAQARFDEIARLALDGENSLVHYLVRAHRAGHPVESANAVFHALRSLIGDCEATYHAAIAQPEPRISVKQRVVL